MRNKRKMIEGQESQIRKARQVDHDDCDDCDDCRTCNSSHWIATLWQRRGWGAGVFFSQGDGGLIGRKILGLMISRSFSPYFFAGGKMGIE